MQQILSHIQILSIQGDQKGIEAYLREQLEIYPNEPVLLSHLASALQSYYFRQEKADTEKLKKEKSREIISLCERALKYYKYTEDNSFPKQLLIFQYEYMNERDKAKEIIASLPYISCTRDMLDADVRKGKEALEHRQSALLISLTQHMHNLFWKIYHDDSYSYKQKIEMLKTDDAMINLITGGKPNAFHWALSVNSAKQAVYFQKQGDDENALDMFEAAFDHADRYENRPDGEKYAHCWLSEIDDKRKYICKTSPCTAYDSVYRIITGPECDLCEAFGGNERFELLMEKLREKISK